MVFLMLNPRGSSFSDHGSPLVVVSLGYQVCRRSTKAWCARHRPPLISPAIFWVANFMRFQHVSNIWIIIDVSSDAILHILSFFLSFPKLEVVCLFFFTLTGPQRVWQDHPRDRGQWAGHKKNEVSEKQFPTQMIGMTLFFVDTCSAHKLKIKLAMQIQLRQGPMT